MNRRRSNSLPILPALLAVVLLGTGCVTNGRRLLMKEFGPSVPVLAESPLKGAVICLKGFTSETNLVLFVPRDKPAEPTPFKYLNLTREQDRMWDQEMKVLQKQVKKDAWREIGRMRNAYGMVMSRVYALNDPAVWLADSLKMDLEAHGAKVVDASQAAAADVSIAGTLRLCSADMYFTVNGVLVVDLEVQPRDGPLLRRQIHTRGATAAVLASEGEYFHAFRDARQKFSIFATREIIAALKPGN